MRKSLYAAVIILVLLVGIVFTIILTKNNIEGDKFEKSNPEILGNRSSNSLLLPDLKVLEPTELYIQRESDTRSIRFSTTFINVGKGPLELIGKADTENQVTVATQNVLTQDESRVQKSVGEFILHPDHEHWHIEDYVEFQLWSIDENRNAEELLRKTEKISFCIWDEAIYDASLPDASKTREYEGCNNEIQGISIGWSDTYSASIDGQELDIRSIENGIYLINTIINVERHILESDYSNNEIEQYVEITEDTITVVD